MFRRLSRGTDASPLSASNSGCDQNGPWRLSFGSARAAQNGVHGVLPFSGGHTLDHSLAKLHPVRQGPSAAFEEGTRATLHLDDKTPTSSCRIMARPSG